MLLEPGLGGPAHIRIAASQLRIVLAVFSVLRIRQVGIELIRSVIPKRNDAAVDTGAAAIVLSHFEHQNLGAVIYRSHGGAHASNAGADNEYIRRTVPLLRKGESSLFRFGRKRKSAGSHCGAESGSLQHAAAGNIDHDSLLIGFHISELDFLMQLVNFYFSRRVTRVR